MLLIIGIGLLIVSIFGLTIIFGPPFLRTHKKPIQTALDLLEIKEGSHLLEFGSGDGSVMIAAAERGAMVTGYEINPLLVMISKWRTRKYRNQIVIHWGNMWQAKIDSNTQNIYMFLDIRFLKKAASLLEQSGEKVNLASYSYKLPGRNPIKTKDGVHLYIFGD